MDENGYNDIPPFSYKKVLVPTAIALSLLFSGVCLFLIPKIIYEYKATDYRAAWLLVGILIGFLILCAGVIIGQIEVVKRNRKNAQFEELVEKKDGFDNLV